MTRLLAVLSAAALVLVSVTGATAVPTTAASATLPTYVSVSTIPSTLVKGDSFKMAVATCRAAPGATIVIERRLPPDGDWFTVATTTLDSSGAATVDLAPRGLTTFDFRTVLTTAGGATSSVQSVTVVRATSQSPNVGVVAATAPRVSPLTVTSAPTTLLRGERFNLEVGMCPPEPAAEALLQRRVAPDGTWSTVRSATLDATGAVSFDMAPRGIAAWDFRAVVGSSTSRVQTVRVSADTSTTPVTTPSTTPPPPTSSRQGVNVLTIPATLDKGGTFAYTVTTTPAAGGAPLHVQKRIGTGDWFTVKKLRLDSRGARSVTLRPIAARAYQYRASVLTASWITSREQTITVVIPPSSTGGSTPVTNGGSVNDSAIKRYQLWDKRADRWLPRGRWVTLHSYQTRTGVPTTHIVQLNLRIKAATGGRPTYLATGWRRADGHRVGEQTFAMPEKGGDGPYHVSHHYTFFNTGNATSAQIFFPGSGRVKVTTEVIKAVAHPSG